MGITRKKLRKLIRESLTESRYSSEDDRRRRIRAKHMGEDPDGPGDPSMSAAYGDPNEKLRGSTIEYPHGRKAFLQSMIDTYRRVGMNEEADKMQAELDAMTDDVFKATLEESLYRLTEERELSDEELMQYADNDEDLSVDELLLKTLKSELSNIPNGPDLDFKMTRDASAANVARIEAVVRESGETLFTVQFNP